jgi:hypothetical protein
MRITSGTAFLAVSVLLPAMLCTAAAGRTIYVDDDATGANNGSSWADAYNYLQDALMMASAGDEIRVAQGIYRPDQFVLSKRPNLGRIETFQMKTGVAIRGGYAGFGEPDPNHRDIEAYETVLSGDLAGDDVDVNDPYGLLNEPTRLENSFHVVTGSGTDGTAVLDGFTITGGNARTHQSLEVGGGMYNIDSRSTIANCKFISNSAGEYGGGMYNDSNQPTLINCTFIGNSAGEFGGGIGNIGGFPSMKDCVFYRNSAGLAGGAMGNSRSSPILNNCTFSGNWAESGGALQNIFSSALFTNCRFVDNSATYQGGAMDNQYYSGPIVRNCMFIGNLAEKGAGIWNILSLPTLANCTFVANSADSGNAVGCGPAVHRQRSKVKLSNCILWDGGDEIWSNNDSSITVSYSDVQGGRMAVYDPCDGLIWGEGNIDADPLFADPGYWGDVNDLKIVVEPNDPNAVWVDGDYHVKSQAGRWDPNSQSWVQDDVTSPCVDAGYQSTPIGYEPFPNGGVINMGAYGGTVEASRSYFGKAVCETIVAGDTNGDCKVDFKDFAIMALHWLEDNSGL